ncbi:MAG: quinolinate synthase NadA [Clostridiales bacterium]|nr:quinolinate synthase NadA [Clostridiales bacterium]
MKKYNLLQEQILQLKKEKNAVIVAHTYQSKEIQEIADLVGDSLQLSQFCANDSSQLIVFCGVHFMAESAKILSPLKTVLLPDIHAGCPMADMVTASDLIEFKKDYPEAKVVCYINSTAKVKAISDICCTSSNAVDIVKSLKAKQVIFVPDQNLGRYVSTFVRETEFIMWNGFCSVHNNLKASDILKLKETYPSALVAMHPECQEEPIKLADFVGSTKAIIDYVLEQEHDEFIIATEQGIIDRINMLDPSKKLHLAGKCLLCKNMKKITLEKVKAALEENIYKVEMDENIMNQARGSLVRMLEASR